MAPRDSDEAAVDGQQRTVTKRRPFRRDQILDAAVKLFNERGYHKTGMNDIGAAVGITGPGIYRHFKNKQAILEALLTDGSKRIQRRIEQIVQEGHPPDETVELLIDNFVENLLDFPAISVTVMGRFADISPQVRATVSRSLRLYVAEWVSALLQVRPELTELEARVLVNGVLSLSHSIDRFVGDMDRDRLAALIKNMATATLFATKSAPVPAAAAEA